MAEPLLRVENLRVELPTRRGVLTALDGISFTIAAGEVLGVVGESGAGKSVTGAAIIGLLEPPLHIAGGRISLAGQRIDNLPYNAMRAIRGKEIGAIFQDPLTSLNPLYTVGHQLVETIRTHLDLSPAAARDRALALLSEVGIAAADERINHYPHQFSGGMRQRIVIALAIAANPQLIIADEPTTALDVSIQAQILALLRRLCRDHGTAVMLITHDIGVIAETAHRVAVMYAGRITEIGAVRDVVANPQLIIADEPTTALDVSIQAQILALLRRLCRDHGTAVMLITHDIGVIAETAHRVAVMYAGRIVEIGAVRDVVANPRHPYTRGLMSSIPRIGGRRDRLRQMEGTMPRLDEFPPGCAFNPRCPEAVERCRRERPDLLSAHTTVAACWLYDKPPTQAPRVFDD